MVALGRAAHPGIAKAHTAHDPEGCRTTDMRSRNADRQMAGNAKMTPRLPTRHSSDNRCGRHFSRLGVRRITDIAGSCRDAPKATSRLASHEVAIAYSCGCKPADLDRKHPTSRKAPKAVIPGEGCFPLSPLRGFEIAAGMESAGLRRAATCCRRFATTLPPSLRD